MSTFMSGMAQKLHTKLDSTECLGRTQNLWIRYHEHIQIVCDFIRAERLSDIQLHIGSSAKMLPVMMVAGHSQYGKATRFIQQQFINLMDRQKPSLSAINTTLSNFQATRGVAYGRTYQSSELKSFTPSSGVAWSALDSAPFSEAIAAYIDIVFFHPPIIGRKV